MDLPTSLQDIGLLWEPHQPGQSETAFRELLAAVRSSDEADVEHEISLLAWIARAQGAQKQLDAAHASLDEAERLLVTHACSAPVAMIRLSLEKGRLHILERIPSQARPPVSEAWTMATQAREEALAAEAAQLMAIIEPQKAQQEWLTRALQIAETSKQPQAKRLLGNLYISFGWKLYDLHQYDKSLLAFQKAHDQFLIQGTRQEVFIAKWSTGKVLRALNRTQEALVIQQSLLNDAGATTPSDGRLFQELAECLHSLKRTTEAQPYFEQAYHALSKDEWVVDNEPATLKRLKDLGKTK